MALEFDCAAYIVTRLVAFLDMLSTMLSLAATLLVIAIIVAMLSAKKEDKTQYDLIKPAIVAILCWAWYLS